MSTESEYTPSRLEVLCRYQEWAGGTSSDRDREAEFDRWLAADRTEAAAKALEDAADIAETGEGTEAEAWADWLRRRATALRTSNGTNR